MGVTEKLLRRLRFTDTPIDGFEERRQAQETANERVINFVRMFGLTALLGLHTSNYIYEFAPFRSPLSLLIAFALGIASCVSLAMYLRRAPRYWPGRKFVLTTVDLSFPLVVLFVQNADGSRPVVASVVPLMAFMILIALSGLRYSRRVVIMAGTQAAVIQLFVFAPVAPESVAFFVRVSVAGLIVMTGVTTFLVGSLMRLHREAVWKERLARFLAPELVEQVAQRPQILDQQTETRVATIMFVDLRGFTTLSEKLSPEQVLALLNLFLEEATAAIMGQKGMVDKYIGDAVMAVFGVPIATTDHAERAVRAALDMRERLGHLNAGLQAAGKPTLRFGIGIHTGEVVAGAIGSTHRLEYTVIGDSVNVASRIESLTRMYPTDILFSDATQQALGERLRAEAVDTVQVKGREQPVTIWTPAAS